MNNVQLPIAESPIVGLQYLANSLNILLNYEESLPWFYSNYIQLMSGTGFNFNCQLTFYPNWFSSIPLLKYHAIKVSELEPGTDIIRFLTDCVDNKNYIYSDFDEFYIPDRRLYGKSHYLHDFFIYGYDAQQKEFYIMGFDQKREYKSSKIKFEHFERAFFSDVTRSQHIHMIEKRDNIKYDFNLQLVYDMLYDYLYCKNSSERFCTGSDVFINKLFGFDIYKYLVEYFERGCEDFRLLHVLYEHKKVMTPRLEYMFNNNYIDDIEFLYDGYKNLENELLNLRNIHLKYTITKSKLLSDKIVTKLQEIEPKERELVEVFIDKVQRKLKCV